jgi:signal transduction histidine kinase
VAKDSQSPPGIASGPSALRPAEFELHCLRLLVAFAGQFHETTDGDKLTRAALRTGMELLGATEGCLAILSPGQRQAEIPFSVPREANWDRDLFTSFIRGGENRIPGELALGRLRRRGRMWGVLAVRAPGGRFRWDHREGLSALAAIASGTLERSDREQLRKVRARIDCKILEQIRPKDLFYQVLHGLYSLTRYDHSASLLMYDAASGAMEVVAEVITWKKAKSERVGSKFPFPDEFLPLLRAGMVYGFDSSAGAWQEWTGRDAVGLVKLATADPARGPAAPPDASRLIAPLATREHVLGLLTVAATHPGSFGPYEAELLGQFLPHASVAIQNSRRTESLELNLIQAERKHAMADLARSVAHDVNNALGAVLPLVQQMRADLSVGHLDGESLAEDLSQIEGSIQVSRRIFGGMLRFARGAAAESGASVRQAVDNTLAILKEGLSRFGIRVTLAVEPELPALPGPQGDLEQLLLNLLTNARDAMPAGGQLTITAGRTGSSIELAVEDTGTGIAPEHLSKIMEPFFSTKPGGNGLGLSICRSIVWQLQGKLDIRSVAGQGTRVTALIPLSPAGGP